MNQKKSLYELSLKPTVENFHRYKLQILCSPENILFDVFYEIYQRKNDKLLAEELLHFPVFVKLLRCGSRRGCLHRIVQHATQILPDCNDALAAAFVAAVEDIVTDLSAAPSAAASSSFSGSNSNREVQRLVDTGLNLGGFLCEAGRYREAHVVLQATHRLAQQTRQSELLRMELLSRMLHALACYCSLAQASNIFNELFSAVWNTAERISPALLCSIYNEFSNFYFIRSEYQDSYSWALKALKFLTKGNISAKVTVDVLRQASKSCVVKREFAKAELLVKHAVCLAREVYGTQHAKYADCLVDLGFYLLNIDCIGPSMQVYKSALDVRLKYFGGNNLMVALAHEDLAYATYVFEYSSGKFQEARQHAEESLRIAKALLPENHLLLASSKRVLALILEEIAIDTQQDPVSKNKLLKEAEELHLFALRMALDNFGERNVHTAKHHGNLGRLYQTMQRFAEAEKMHQKAIQIKESLLGKEDYEVALSVGHLASLYNYDMEEYGKAEELYLRSIRIGRKLFGPSYSGLEYDYRGLIQVYNSTANFVKLAEYTRVLQEWNILRDQKDNEQETAEIVEMKSNLSLAELVRTIGSLPDLAANGSAAAAAAVVVTNAPITA